MVTNTDSLKQVEQDLQAFADPGVPVIVDRKSAVWEQGGRQMSIEFVRSSSGALPEIQFEGTRQTYRQFLAGPAMADLKRLANYIQKTGRRTPNLIDTSADWDNEDTGAHEVISATQLIGRQSTTDLPFLSTRVVLVQGEAGSGKTIALRQLTGDQARLYVEGKAETLYFYVNAQGRALSRLEDAMAKDLQDLRSSFSYAAIAPLTRRNLIVPIIDGFDELLGSGGYDEAFSSLSALLSLLAGEGVVIASARSAFFDYRNFYENAKRFSGDGSLNYEVDVIKVRPWSESQVREYVAAVAKDRGRPPEDVLDALVTLEQGLSVPDRRLLSKPFYATQVAELLLAGAVFSTTEALLDQLVDAFLDRENKKLLDKEGQPLLSTKGHRTFLVQLAEEMWWQESRQVDVGTVQTVAELVVENLGLPPGSVRAIVERVSSYGFLSTDGTDRGALRFEHEVFYSYFLAHKIRECIQDAPSDLRRLLTRGVIDETLASQTARLIGPDVGRATRAVVAISEVLRPGASEIVARANAGRLIAGIFANAGAARPGVAITNAVFKQVSFGSVTLDEPVFERCDFDEVDLTEARLNRPRFSDCALRSVIVDLSVTRIASATSELLDQVFSVEVAVGNGDIPVGKYFGPREIAEILAHLGMKVAPRPKVRDARTSVAEKRLELASKFLLKMRRRFYLSASDLARFPFVRDSEWKGVFAKLTEHGVVEELEIVKSGPRETMFKLAYPPEIVRRGENSADITVPPNVHAFWRDIAAQ